MKMLIMRSRTVKIGDTFQKFAYELEDDVFREDINRLRREIIVCMETWLNEDVRGTKENKMSRVKANACFDCGVKVEGTYKRCFECNKKHNASG